ncbi:MAG TPA: substrate-binding domain-containing protein [Verrucomicrobiae bacterium]|nr:substrate-binding domain-containing protein [Verrucomicrobiae bacterium]
MKVPNAMLRRVLVTLQMIIGPLVALMLLTGEATSADIRVFSGGGPQDALRHLAPEFERATGHHVEFTFQLVTEIQRKLAAGEKADVIVLPVPLIAATAKTVPLRTEGRIVLARGGIAVIVRQGTTPPDISTAEAVRKMLLNARAIAWSDPSTPVGGSLNRAIAQLGIADEVRPKLIITSAIHGGADLVARGDADLGLFLLSEVRTARGTTLVGLLPSPLQSFVVYGTAVPTYNATPEAALAFVKFISDPSRSERWKAAGFELMGSP